MKKIILDTGYFISIMNPADIYHKEAISCTKKWENSAQFITTWPVLTEVSHLLLKRMAKKYLPFIKSLSLNLFEIFSLKENHFLRLEQLIQKYEALPIDLADASLVILAEEIDSGFIFSTDQRDFETYRWKRRKPFENLLPPI